MFRTGLKLILRNIWKYKGTSAINILGLSAGMAGAILLLLWVNYHLGFDRFQEHSDRVYRVIQHIRFEDMTTWAITQGPLGPSLKAEVPEIADYCRLLHSGLQFRKGEDLVGEIGTYADPSIFKMFTIRVTKKLTDVPVSEPNQIAISETMARKYFGDEDPLGKTMQAIPDRDFLVTAVFEDYPRQTHWWFDYIIPFENLGTLGYTIDKWNNSGYHNYVELKPGVTQEEAVAKISDFLKPKPTLEEFATLDLQPLRDIHFTTGIDFDGANTIDGKYLRTFAAIGFFLILIACINFMNLATARSSGRMREIGMKKVLGGHRSSLLFQFIGEAVLISLISVLIAMMIVELLRPAFNNITGIGLSIDYSDFRIYLYLTGFALITGILAGWYPALYLSSFKPITALRGETERVKNRSGLRTVLVIFQFVISIILITTTLVISSQITYMVNKDLGYDREGVIYFGMSRGFAKNFESIRSDLLGYPAVKEMTRVSSLPTRGYSFSNSRFRWDGQDLSKETLFRALFAGYDYTETLKIEIEEGRPFSRDFASDSNAIILNEAAVRVAGLKNPVGMEFRQVSTSGEIQRYHVVGVARDYNYRSLHSEIEPQIIIFEPRNCYWAMLKIDLHEFKAVKEKLQQHWSLYESPNPINISFLDESLAALYREDRVIRNIILFFTFNGLLISVLGLIGLTGFTIERKTREIGIRKVVGAGLPDILGMISSDFLKWILVSLLVSVPVSWYFMAGWLKQYPYRIGLHWWLLLGGGLIAILVAFVTIALQSIKAARANLVECLKYE